MHTDWSFYNRLKIVQFIQSTVIIRNYNVQGLPLIIRDQLRSLSHNLQFNVMLIVILRLISSVKRLTLLFVLPFKQLALSLSPVTYCEVIHILVHLNVFLQRLNKLGLFSSCSLFSGFLLQTDAVQCLTARCLAISLYVI